MSPKSVLKSYSDVLCNSEFVGISADIDILNYYVAYKNGE